MKSFYSVNGVLLNIDSSNSKELLKSLHDEKVRPLCECKVNSKAEMYIALIGDDYYIKRMPSTGKSHDPLCEHYDVPIELSGRGELEDSAIKVDSKSGETKLRLDFSINKSLKTRSLPTFDDELKNTVTTDPKKLTILSFFHLLYEDSSLNSFNSKFSSYISWSFIRSSLYGASDSKNVKNSSLGDILFIPETFSVKDKDKIDLKRKRFFSNFISNGITQKVGIIIGEVKRIEKARFGYKLILKHLPSTPCFLSEDLYKKLLKNFSFELALFEEDEKPHLLCVFSFIVSSSGNVQIDTISLMMVDSKWIPFSSLEELELINFAYDNKRSFIKGLRYNLSKSKVIASFILTDLEKPKAVYIVPLNADENFYNELYLLINDSSLDSLVLDLNDDEYKLSLD